MFAQATHKTKRLTGVATWEPLPGFSEVAPNVWVPDGYEPNPFERTSPIVETTNHAAVEYVKCQQSLPYFVTTHCWTLHVDDPLTGQPTFRKFPCYPYVLEALTFAQKIENFHVEKSRQLLFSWLWMSVFLWDVLFHEKWGNVAFSTVENLVDDGAENSTHDSLFGKVRIMWQGLPPYLRHAMSFRHMLIQCPANGSYLRGRAATPKGGRGPAYKRGLMDEAAHMERGTQLYHGLRASVKFGLIMNSSPLGKGNVFATIRFKEGSTFRKLSYHWSRHPEHAVGMYCECGWMCQGAETLEAVKAMTVPPHEQFQRHICQPDEKGRRPAERRKMRSPWYDVATADYTPEQIASEYDISYEKSQRGRVYDTFDSSRLTFDYQDKVPPRGIGETMQAYRERYLRSMLKKGRVTVVGMDFGVASPVSCCLGQIVDDESMEIEWLDEEEHSGWGWVALHTFLSTFWMPVVREATGLDLQFYGDPAGKARSENLTSWIANLNSATPRVQVVHAPSGGGVLEWLDFIREIQRRGHMRVSLWCAQMIDCFGQYHFPLDGDGNPLVGDHIPGPQPWGHKMDAMRYVYKFRYHARLKNVNKRGVSIESMLKAGPRDVPPTKAPAVF